MRGFNKKPSNKQPTQSTNRDAKDTRSTRRELSEEDREAITIIQMNLELYKLKMQLNSTLNLNKDKSVNTGPSAPIANTSSAPTTTPVVMPQQIRSSAPTSTPIVMPKQIQSSAPLPTPMVAPLESEEDDIPSGFNHTAIYESLRKLELEQQSQQSSTEAEQPKVTSDSSSDDENTSPSKSRPSSRSLVDSIASTNKSGPSPSSITILELMRSQTPAPPSASTTDSKPTLFRRSQTPDPNSVVSPVVNKNFGNKGKTK